MTDKSFSHEDLALAQDLSAAWNDFRSKVCRAMRDAEVAEIAFKACHDSSPLAQAIDAFVRRTGS